MSFISKIHLLLMLLSAHIINYYLNQADYLG